MRFWRADSGRGMDVHRVPVMMLMMNTVITVVSQYLPSQKRKMRAEGYVIFS